MKNNWKTEKTREIRNIWFKKFCSHLGCPQYCKHPTKIDQEQDMNGTEEVSISFNVFTFKEKISVQIGTLYLLYLELRNASSSSNSH